MIDVLSIATNGYLSKYGWPLSIATDGYLSVYAIIAIGGFAGGDMELREIVSKDRLEERIRAQRRNDEEILLIIQIFMSKWD